MQMLILNIDKRRILYESIFKIFDSLKKKIAWIITIETIEYAREVCLLFLSRKAGIAARYEIYAVKLIFINPVKNIPK